MTVYCYFHRRVTFPKVLFSHSITDNVKIVDSPHHCSYVYESIGLVCLALFAGAQISWDCHTNTHLVLYLTLQVALYFLINFLFEVTNIRSLLFRLLGTAGFAGLASLFLLHIFLFVFLSRWEYLDLKGFIFHVWCWCYDCWQLLCVGLSFRKSWLSWYHFFVSASYYFCLFSFQEGHTLI